MLAWSSGIASSLPAVPCQVQHSSAGLGAAFLVVIIQSMAFGNLMGKSSCEVCGAKFHHQSCPSCPRFVQEPSNLVLKILNLPNPFLRLQGILKAYTFRRACEGCFLHPVSKARGCLTNAWSGDAITRAWLVIVSSYRFDFDSCYLVLLYLSSMIQHYSEESSGYWFMWCMKFVACHVWQDQLLLQGRPFLQRFFPMFTCFMTIIMY